MLREPLASGRAEVSSRELSYLPEEGARGGGDEVTDARDVDVTLTRMGT